MTIRNKKKYCSMTAMSCTKCGCFLLLSFVLAVLSLGTKADELKLVHVLYRHGDRSPYILIPNDINNTEDTWPQGIGEMTPRGMAQQFQLGELLRQRYSENIRFLSLNYTQSEIYVYADDFNRTLTASMSNLAGLYAKSKSFVDIPGWPSPYWQPIPVHTLPLKDDIILYYGAPCPKTDEIFQKVVMQQENYLSIERSYQPLFDYLNTVTGFDHKIDFHTIEDVADPLKCEFFHYPDHKWPNFINRTTFDNIVQALNKFTTFMYSHLEIAKLRGGNLLGDIVKRMLQKRSAMTSVTDKSLNWVRKLKMYQYSAHDVTILPLLVTLGAAKYVHGEYPGYSSCISFELWTDNSDNYYVKVFYRHNVTSDFVQINVNGCPSILENCSLDTFYQRSIPFMPVDWEKECTISDDDC